MVKFFDRYILKEIVPPFLVGLLVYSFVLLMNQVFILSELFIARGVSFGVVARIFLYLIPSVLAFAVPMSVLMGILAGLSRLSSDSEIVAFRTLGIRNTRLLWPVLFFAFVGWLMTSALALYLAPWSNYRWVQTLTRSVLSKVQLNVKPREFNESIPQTVLFIQDITPDNQWKNVFVHLSNRPDEERLILARAGRLNFFPEAKRATLELFGGALHTLPAGEPEHYSITFFQRIEEEINVESLFAQFSSEKRVREKDIGELFRGIEKIKQKQTGLRRELSKQEAVSGGPPEAASRRREIRFALEQSGREWRSHWVEVHKKFALPFVCFIFVFLGIPLGISTRKGGRTSGFTLSLGVILVYYVLITAGEKMAMEERLSPFLGMWGPNIVFLLLGGYLFVRATKESPLFRLRSERRKKRRTRVLLLRIRVRPTGRQFSSGWRWPKLELRFPNILDRYIMRKSSAIFLLVFSALLLISAIVTFFERIDNIYEHRKPLSLLFEYIEYRIPEFSSYALPVAVLTAALLTLGLMTKSNEITAMKACGVSIYRLILPVLFLSGLICLFALALQERILPSANKKAEEIWNAINDVPARSYSFLDRRWVLGRNKSRIYHYTYFEPARGAFSQLSFYDLDLPTWSLKRRIYAGKAHLEGAMMNLIEGWVRDFGKERESRFETFADQKISLEEEASYFVKEWTEPALMSFRELKTYIAEVEGMGFETTRFKVDLQAKLSFPFVSLIMALLAVPFAFSMGKRGALVGLGLSVAIAMIYWGALGVFRSLGYIGFLSPFLSSWGPNLLFAPLGLYLIFRLRT